MKKILSLLFYFCTLAADDIVMATKRIELEGYPGAYNPSLIKVEQGFLLSFRYTPKRYEQPWLSYIGVVLLNGDFEPISEPELLNTRSRNSKTPSQSEDARFFSYRGRIFLIYNDNVDLVYVCPARRDMFIAELFYKNDHFTLSSPLKLNYPHKSHVWQQKNWIPFEWNKTLLMGYSIHPHEILYPNLSDGECYRLYETSPAIKWDFGALRGSSSPELIGGEYLAFFHSGIVTSSLSSHGQELWHYYMGAYTFSAEPPFQITKMSPLPIMTEGFYTPSDCEKRVIFPGGFVVSGSSIYVAYGKDDREMWIATLNKAALKNSLVPVKSNQ